MLPLTGGSKNCAQGGIDEKDDIDPEKEILDENGLVIVTTNPALDPSNPTQGQRVGRKEKLNKASSKWKSFFGWRATKNSVQAKHKESEKKNGDLEKGGSKKSKRPIRLFTPVYGGLGAGLSLCELNFYFYYLTYSLI